nr:G3P acyltransferase [Klebsiella pneumoniae]
MRIIHRCREYNDIFKTEQRYECNRAGLVLLAYLCGSISSAILVCRLAGLPDPRDSGSGNPGPLTYYELAEKGRP